MTLTLSTRAATAAAAILLALPVARAQPGAGTPSILTDALLFHGSELAEKEFLDLYVSVPYRSLEFREYDDRYAGQFTTNIVLRDQLGRRLHDTLIKRSVLTESYNEAGGGTGKTENAVVRFALKPGTIRYEVTVKDAFSHREFQTTDTVDVRDLTRTPALSSVLYVSEIEQRGSKYAITPYVGSTIWAGDKQLFAFFEMYVDDVPQSTIFRWKIASADGRALGSGATSAITLDGRTTRHFFPLRPLERALPGSYTLRVTAHPVVRGEADTTVILASTEKRYIVPRTLVGSIMADINASIRQLAYAADQDQIDGMLDAKDPAERQFRFEQFWKAQDPSPQTVRNEAFEEYYARIATANTRFKSYAEGWLTDMGRVYIVYGEPVNTEQFAGQTGSVLIVRWTYLNNISFTFEDNTGFGDYRLRTPIPPSAKYQYRP